MSIVPASVANAPWKVVLLLCAIAGFGIVVLYSAAGGSMSPWALLQSIRFTVFLVAALVISRFPVELWARAAYPGYAIVLILLVGVEALGAVKGGSQRWLDLGFIRLQPSELMKVAVVLAAARFYAQLPPGESRGLNALWPALVLIGMPAALVMLQPDLGTALAISAGGITIMFLSGLPLSWFIGSALAGAAALPVLFSTLHDYQQRRILIFLDPESDPLGAGYHISQSKIAIGSGGIFGKGFLNGSQSHLDYLPEGHTDFVFATIAEEWGLVGGALIILAFAMVIRWGMMVSYRASSRFARLAAAGLSATIFFYVAVNLMMVMGLAPVVGIPLPLVSFGGSAVMTVMLCLGLLMAFERQQRSRTRPPGSA